MSMETTIHYLLLSSETLRFKINLALLQENGDKQPLTILATTPVLSTFLQKLIETKSLIRQPDSTANLIIERHMGSPYWDLNFTSKYPIEILQIFAEIQFLKHNQMQLRGSLTQCFKLGGSFSSGIISLYKAKVNNSLLEKVIACDKMETIIHTPQMITSDEIAKDQRYNYDISINDEKESYSKTTLVSTTLTFNRREIRKILGPGGARLDSIRIQLKCWIHVNLTPFEQYVDDNLRFISKNNAKQEITINGLKQNVDIAIKEIYNCIESN